METPVDQPTIADGMNTVEQPSADLHSGSEIADDGLEDDDREWLERESPTLQVLAGPDIRGRIAGALERAISRPMGPDSSSHMFNAVNTVIGDERTANFLLTLVWRGTREPELLVALADRAADETVPWVRSLAAMYGEDLRRARQLEDQEPLGWFQLNRSINYNYVTDQVRVRLEVMRNIGDSVEIIDTPSNIQGLAGALVDTLIILPDRDRAANLNAEALDELAGRCAELAESIREYDARAAIAEASSESTTELGAATPAAEAEQPASDDPAFP